MVALLAGNAGASAQTSVVSRFGNWTLYSHSSGQTRLCFAASQPTLSEPAGARRDSVFFYVTSWPAQGVKSELSVKVGYRVRRNSEVTIAIGLNVFKMFAVEDRAFVSDATEELKALDAMKRSAIMVIQGTSERGTATKDTFSLTGFSQALQALGAGCS
jgi:hypothetical protein